MRLSLYAGRNHTNSHKVSRREVNCKTAIVLTAASGSLESQDLGELTVQLERRYKRLVSSLPEELMWGMMRERCYPAQTVTSVGEEE